LVLTLAEKNTYLLVNPYKGRVTKTEDVSGETSHIYIPTKIFIDAVVLNMFHHGSISKRNKYIFHDIRNLKMFTRFQAELEKVEMGVYPVRFAYIKKLIFAYVRRRHELLVYFKALILKFRGLPMYKIEEEILKGN
jgi:hypothetical protein